MKKILTLLAIVLFAFSSFAQDLSDQFYFRFGYSSPSWSQFELNEQDWNGRGIDSKIGASFEMGSIFMINSILNKENAAFGINADYLYILGSRFKTRSDAYDENLAVFRIGSKVGPSFTYSPIDKMAFDVYAKADIAWVTNAVIYDSDIIDDADDSYMGYVDFGFSTGINFRYGLLILGFEYNTNSSELESHDNEGTYLQEEIGKYMDHNIPDGKKSKLPCMNFTIGMSF